MRSATIGDSNTVPHGSFNAACGITDPTSGVACAVAEQTWANGAAAIGGQSATADDTATNNDAGPGDTWTSVTVSGADVTGVNFGFAYNVIVNTNNAGQGSLGQFIANANAIGSANGTTANYSEFVVPAGALTAGVAVITPTAALAAISDAGTTIDGTTQTDNIGNTNAVTLGAGGTVGVDGLSLSQVNGPEVEINSSNTVRTGLDVQANSVTIRGIAIHGFGQNLDFDVDVNIRVGLDATTDFTGILIEGNVIGASATSFSSPAVPTDGNGVIVLGADDGIFRGNLVGFNFLSGFKTFYDVTGWQIENNELRSNGTTTQFGDGIDFDGAETGTISGNLLIDNGACGFDSWDAGGSHTITNNTIRGNGFAGQANQETSGVRLFGTDSEVSLNVIENNFGAGVLVVGNGARPNQPAFRNQVTRNAFSGNGSVAVDLLESAGDVSFGDGVTVNDGALDANVGNSGLDFPVIDAAYIVGGNLTVTGYARPDVQIEFYEAVGAANDNNASGNPHGEGATYLFTETEGVADADATTAATYNDPGYGTDPSVNRFNFTIATPAGLVIGDEISAIAYDAVAGTSEFGPNFTVTVPPNQITGTVFEDVNYGGGLGRDLATAATDAPSFTVGRSGATVELYDTGGNFLTSTATIAGGSYSFYVIPGTYTVRVVNSTVTSSRPGSNGSELAVQTYRIDGAAEAAGDGAKKVGGELPSNEDAAANSGAQTLAALQGMDLDADGITEWTQSIVTVDASAGDVSGIDFGFNFNVVVNTNNAGQGSLRQFIINSNLLN